jgi:hypothetical protein
MARYRPLAIVAAAGVNKRFQTPSCRFSEISIMFKPRLFVVAVVCCSVASVARGDVKLPPFFSDHMVLQREGKAPIWGTATAGEQVTVTFRGEAKQATADADGNYW